VALARGLLVVLALALPFEAPVLRVGPLQLTSVEVVLYALLAVWGAALARDVLRARSLSPVADALRLDPPARAAALWAIVVVASALAAPTYRAAALKFALRSLSGILVFFAARSLSRAPETGRRVVIALVVGAVGSAATAVAEWCAPDAGLWTAFHEASFDTSGLPRASGVFEYPTIAAMYWEAALPLAVVAPLLGRSTGTSWKATALAVAACAPLCAGLLVSATRSGLAGAAVASVGLAALGWRGGIGLRRGTAAVAGVLVLTSSIAIAAGGSGSLLGHRLRWWEDAAWFRVEYEVGAVPSRLRAGESFTVAVRLRNTGVLAWRSGGTGSVRLSYHWDPVDRPPTRGDYEGARTPLPGDVPAGGTVDVVAVAWSPPTPGPYRLRWDLVQEHVTWFSEHGNAAPAQPVLVEGPPSSAPGEKDAAAPLPAAPLPPPHRAALWRAAIALWRERPLLGIGPDNFRRRYEDVIAAPDGRRYEDTRMHANNLYLETLADLGLAGAAALAWIALSLGRWLRALSRTGHVAGLGCGVAAAAFFVHGWMDYFFEFTSLFGLFWLAMGLTAARADEPRNEARTGSPS
jgi:hypothetical protein